MLLTIDQPYANHNGGQVTHRPRRLAVHRHGRRRIRRRSRTARAQRRRAARQDPAHRSRRRPATRRTRMPADNPFVGVEGALPEIWSVGVRNPWRMQLRPGDRRPVVRRRRSGRVVEEIDVALGGRRRRARGRTSGGARSRARSRFNDDQSPDGATPPIYEYEHGDAGCSVSGGARLPRRGDPGAGRLVRVRRLLQRQPVRAARAGSSAGRHAGAGQRTVDHSRAGRS